MPLLKVLFSHSVFDAINTTTSEMIAGTAARLKTQGTQIHQQATSTMLDMDALRSAFEDIDAALDEISRYRREALPTMAGNILELDRLTAESEEAIERMESGRSATDRLEDGSTVIEATTTDVTTSDTSATDTAGGPHT